MQKSIVNRFGKIKEIIDFDDQEQKVRRQTLTSPVRKTLWDSFPGVLPAFPLIISEKVDSSKYPKVVKEYTWKLIRMSDLREIKQAIVAYRLHLSFVREMVKTWAFSNKATSHNWTQLISTVLESGLQLHWRCFLKEKARILEQQERTKGTESPLIKF